jgi:methylated-DNA-[protein]-cysteine S-methyltransferase
VTQTATPLLRWMVLPSPVGDLLLTSDGEALTGIAFSPHDELLERCRAEGRRHAALPVLAAAATQLGEYFADQRREFDLPLAPEGTEFRRRVWNALRTIPYGQTRTYGQVADSVECRAPRAVGQANRHNPIPIVIPCHRVLAFNGIGGYAGQWDRGEGLDRKRWLLRHEGVEV